MVRSIGIVMIVVVALFYFAQASPQDKKAVRVVDPSQDVRSFARVAPAAPVPMLLPATWRPTVTERLAGPDRLRVGYLTPSGEYAEYDAVRGPPGGFVDDVTGRAPPGPRVIVGGRSFEQRRGPDGPLSLVLVQGGATVVLGSLRSSASPEELAVLAASLAPGTA